jgi:hypothetical protein
MERLSGIGTTRMSSSAVGDARQQETEDSQIHRLHDLGIISFIPVPIIKRPFWHVIFREVIPDNRVLGTGVDMPDYLSG